MRSLGIDNLCMFGMPPVDHINLTADLGCQTITVSTMPNQNNPHGYVPYSLVDDKQLRRDTKAALADRGVSIFSVEGFFVIPGLDVRDSAANLDAMCELGIPRLTTISLEPDLGRTQDQLAALMEMAEERNLGLLVEMVPMLTPLSDAPTALKAIAHVNNPNCKLLIDAMHWIRAGHTVADAAAVDPAVIGYFQICDAPLPPVLDYSAEAGFERRAPGEGDLPILDLLAAMPKGLPVGLEIPQLSLAEAGVGPRERLKNCVDRSRDLLAQLT